MFALNRKTTLKMLGENSFDRVHDLKTCSEFLISPESSEVHNFPGRSTIMSKTLHFSTSNNSAMPSPISFKLQNMLFGTQSTHCANNRLKVEIINFWSINLTYELPINASCY